MRRIRMHVRQLQRKRASMKMQTMLNRLRGPSRLLFRRLVGMAERFAPLREDGRRCGPGLASAAPDVT